MIPTLILLTIRRWRKMDPVCREVFKKQLLWYLMKISLLLGFFLFSTGTKGQEKSLKYAITRNGDSIGNLNLVEEKNGDKTLFRLNSDIKMSMLFTITAKGREEAEYEKGILKTSRISQTVNGKEKVNKQTTHFGSYYVVKHAGKETKINHSSITYNMVCLYTSEPVGRTFIYSDKYNKILKVIKTGDHRYKIEFPGGNSNEYSYSNGICTTIKVESTLYSIVMQLKEYSL